MRQITGYYVILRHESYHTRGIPAVRTAVVCYIRCVIVPGNWYLVHDNIINKYTWYIHT